MDFELMREFSWSWADLRDCPAYVRVFCWDLLQARRQAEQDANERAHSEARRG